MTTTKYDRQRPKRQPPAVSIASLRKSHGLKQPEVLARIKENCGRTYTVGALSAIELGHRGASEQFLADLAEVFGLEPEEMWVNYIPRAQAGEDAA